MARTTCFVLEDNQWKEDLLDASNPDEVREAINKPDVSVWVDVEGDQEGIAEALATFVGEGILEGFTLARASRGGQSPPENPPKARVFRDFVFGRAYWLGTEPEKAGSPERLLAQEVHVVAGSSFVITMRYPVLGWDVGREELEPHAVPSPGMKLQSLKDGVIELRRRFGHEGGSCYGLDVAAVLLDIVIDSLFDSLNGLRRGADAIETKMVEGAWLWQKSKPDGGRSLEHQAIGLRRLLRQVRWAFMPDDEIDEFCTVPFMQATDPHLKARFEDMRREANRAVATVHDIASQVDQTVELGKSMKTDRLNQTMYSLTVAATVILVPTLIAGIYGMNFRYMPELKMHVGYWGVLVAMAAVMTATWAISRWWLKRSWRKIVGTKSEE